jgi:hypothetical protein
MDSATCVRLLISELDLHKGLYVAYANGRADGQRF